MASPLTIQPSSKDSRITSSAATTNYGSEAYIITRPDSVIIHALAEFAITWGTDIPDGVTITSATLKLYYYNYGAGSDPVGRTIYADRLLRLNWVEGEVTYNIYKTGSDWTTAGCNGDGTDFTSTGRASATVPASYGWMEWNVLTQVQWAQTNSAQIAFVLRDSSEGGGTQYQVRWYSKEEAVQTTLRPTLIIAYTEAGGWSNIAKVNGVTATDLAKVRGIAVADIAKRRGVAV
jgi:hypothetical protein